MHLLLRILAAGCAAVPLLACSPTLNWRELALDEGRLQTTFPCKPDRAQRTQTLGGHEVTLHMAGCEAGGALFVVAHLELPPGVPAQPLLAHWQHDAVQKLQASSWSDEAARIKGAAQEPAPLRRRAQGVDARGRALAMEAVWFTRGAHLYHAAIYAPQLGTAMRDPFFGALELR